MVHTQHQKSGQKCSIHKKTTEDTEETILGIIPRDKRKIHNKEEKFFTTKQPSNTRNFQVPLTQFSEFPYPTGEVLQG